METIKVPVANLKGSALDFAYSKIDPMCEGIFWQQVKGSSLWIGSSYINGQEIMCAYLPLSANIREQNKFITKDMIAYSPSTDWYTGGKLLEEHVTSFKRKSEQSFIVFGNDNSSQTGETLLIATIRLVVYKALGSMIDLPKGLVTN
jgi:hypothetical protein